MVALPPDFAGETDRLCARYRRDLPRAQAAALAECLRLRPTDILIDLGSGTGQLGVPLVGYCAAVVAVDPEPEMLRGLRARGIARLTGVLGDDSDLPLLGRLLPGLSSCRIGLRHGRGDPRQPSGPDQVCQSLVTVGAGMSAVPLGYLAHPDWVRRQRVEDAGVADPGISADRQESHIEGGDALVLSRIRDRRRPDHQRRPTSVPYVPEHSGEVRSGVRSGHPRLGGPLLDSGVVDAERDDYPTVTAGWQPGGALHPPSVRDVPAGLAAYSPVSTWSAAAQRGVCARQHVLPSPGGRGRRRR